MESRSFDESSGGDTRVFFGFSVTDANLIMSDGKSLENLGVTPDEYIAPLQPRISPPAVIRLCLDPRQNLVRGPTLSPEQAGELFPIEWLPL